MKIIKLIIRIVLVCVLTIFTQIGGVIYLLSFLTHRIIHKWTNRHMYQWLLKLASFVALYGLATFLLVPVLAKPFGRVALPLTTTRHLQPLNILTCLMNRNYVRPELKQTAFEVAEQMHGQFPGTEVNYLEANFPFFNGFPLFPHLSHNDGKKLDISFCYTDNRTAAATNKCPSFIGYGICEEPLPGEISTAEVCAEKGYWQYNFLRKIMPQGNKKYYSLDNVRTKALVDLFAAQPAIGKIFIEPHLKTRLRLTTEKVRFHGCQAVRHDDHIHIQLH